MYIYKKGFKTLNTTFHEVKAISTKIPTTDLKPKQIHLHIGFMPLLLKYESRFFQAETITHFFLYGDEHTYLFD